MKRSTHILAILFLLLFFNLNLRAEETSTLNPPLLDPNEAVEIAWKYIVDKGVDVDRFKYTIDVVFFSYTKRQWLIFFDGDVPIGGDFFLYIEDKHNPTIRFVGGA